jgi:hypothetical protein
MAALIDQLKPRNGRTLGHTVDDMDADLRAHCTKADAWFSDNNEAHKTLNAKIDSQALRIDGLFELFGTPNAPRKAAERHRNREELA